MEALYKAYKDNEKVKIFLVYVNEAHPSKRTTTNPADKGSGGIGRHKNIDEKVLAASKCMEGLKLTLPVVIDGMEGAAEKAYTGRPSATAVVDLDGKIAFYSVGPGGVKPKEAGKVIKRLIAKGGFPTTRPTSGPATKPTRRPTAGSTTRPATRPTTRPATAVRE